MDEMEATPEQKKELTVKAIGIAGFERVGDMDVYTQEHGLMKIVVDLTAGVSVYFSDQNKNRIDEDDEYETIKNVKTIISEAEDARMPSRTEPDEVVNVTRTENPADDALTQAEPVPTEPVNMPAVREPARALAPSAPTDLSVSTIKKYINDKATDEEAYVFLQLCKARGLNPFLNEAYLIKYDHVSAATMVVGKDAFMKRAESHIEYDGFEAGIIVESGSKEDYVVVDDNRVGTFLRDDETLLGGWAKVYRKDRTHPVEITVSINEYDTGKSSWSKRPATMIRKVALIQALREAFPSELSGMYDQSEMGAAGKLMTPKTIVKLQASNVMNIDAIVVDANGNNVTLTGKNGAGKSAFLKAIEFALSGKALAATPEPVRHGEKSGDILLDLGDIIVKRHFTNESSTVKIENKDGMVFKSPQALLDKFRGNISFDPIEFSSLPEKQQKEVLLGMIDLPIDLDELDLKRKGIYDSRTEVNRDLNRLEGQRDGIPNLPDVPEEELSSVDVMAEMQAATEQISENNNMKSDLEYAVLDKETIERSLSHNESEVKRLTEDGDKLRAEIRKAIHKEISLKESVESLVYPDLEQFKCMLGDVEQINVQVRQKKQLNLLISQINDLKSTSLGMTVDITAIDTLKTKTISEAGMPVDGLGFSESGVTFDDVPLSQCSDGQKRIISARIGMAMNPDLRVLWLNDASLLDSDSIQEIKDIADENGYQLWLECVSDDEKVGVHIEAKEV